MQQILTIQSYLSSIIQNSIFKLVKSLSELIKRINTPISFISYNEILYPQVPGKTPPLRNREIHILALYLGFSKRNEKVKDQPVYTNGRVFIVQDIDSHIGGTWKMAETVNGLRSKRTRMGTYDPLLNRMGD